MTRNSPHIPLLFLASLLLGGSLSACGGEEACTLGTAEGCADGLVCDEDASGEPLCVAPVMLEGRVFDAQTGAAIEGARIVALDANGGARSGVTFSGIDGRYALQVSIPRGDSGAPTAEAITLRVDAADYDTFPTPPRQALPIDVGQAQLVDERYVIDNAATDVALLPHRSRGGADIAGHVTGPAGPEGGVLVVATQSEGVAVSTSITGSDGSFVLYNVPLGDTALDGYRAGLNVDGVSVTAVAEGLEGVELLGGDAGLATVSGSVNIVNAPGGLTTSVILVVLDTFNATVARGEAPAGLRAAPVSSSFTIEGVPPGRYAVLAAFENDDLVRDPDEGISGTAIATITVQGSDVDVSESFKVTEALAVVSPGADGIEVVTSVPTLSWAQDSSEDNYEVRVYDAFGDLIHEDNNVPSVSGSAPITYDLDGRVTLDPGMIYQFRAWSVGRGSRLSATEDLRGVFQYQP